MNDRLKGPALRGGLLALAAAALFGFSTPLLQRFGAGLGPFATASLLYLGAALAGLLLRQPVEREARLRRADLTGQTEAAAAVALAALLRADMSPEAA